MAIPSMTLLVALVGPCGTAQEKPNAAPPPATAGSGSGRQLTIEEAEAIGLRSNPQITVGKLQALESREFARERRAALMPEVNVSVTAVDSIPGSRITAGFLTNPIVYPRAAAGVTLTQLITDFGRTMNLV